MYIFFKRSAIHNLLITDCYKRLSSDEVGEGIVIPKNILEKSDIVPWEQIILTKIKGDNWKNRIKTFVIPGEENGGVEARGSISSFLRPGDLVCIISRTILDCNEVNLYRQNLFPIFDLGFDPFLNKNNLITPRLDVEYFDRKEKDVKIYKNLIQKRNKFKRIYLQSLILGLKVNKTNPDCLQGSAELPGLIMEKAEIQKFQSVTVYNFSKGGAADTYAVPMPPGVVMTTGAMARLAKVGETVSVATYTIGDKFISPKIVFTDGSAFSGTIKALSGFF